MRLKKKAGGNTGLSALSRGIKRVSQFWGKVLGGVDDGQWRIEPKGGGQSFLSGLGEDGAFFLKLNIIIMICGQL